MGRRYLKEFYEKKSRAVLWLIQNVWAVIEIWMDSTFHIVKNGVGVSAQIDIQNFKYNADDLNLPLRSS